MAPFLRSGRRLHAAQEKPIETMNYGSDMINGLAVEIVEIIANCLEPKDLLSLRLVSRRFSNITFTLFARAFFTTVTMDFTPAGFEKIQTLSQNQDFAPYVRALCINHQPSDRWQMVQKTKKLRANAVTDMRKVTRRSSRLGAKSLCDILTNSLINCRSFLIKYKTAEYQHESSDSISRGHPLLIILEIVATTGLAIEGLEMITPSYRFCLDTSSVNQTLRRRTLFSRFNNGWKSIRKLAFGHRITQDQLDWILPLIASAPKLQELALEFDDATPNSNSWSTSRPFIRGLSNINACPTLQKLNLKYAQVEAETFSKFLAHRCTTLRSLTFDYLNIGSGATWSDMLTKFSRELPHLRSFSISWISENAAPDRRVVMFNGLERVFAKPLTPKLKQAVPFDTEFQMG